MKKLQNWIKFQVSRQLGVSANLHFFTTEKIIWQMAQDSLKGNSSFQSNPFSKERIAWKIRNILSEIITEYPSEFNLVYSFIDKDDPLKKIQFCWEVATFLTVTYIANRTRKIGKMESSYKNQMSQRRFFRNG